MAKKISELDPATTGAEGDLYPVVQSSDTRKQTRAQLRDAIVAGWQSFVGSFLGAGDQATARAAIGALGSSSNTTGSAAKLTTPRTISTTGAATGSASFDGSADAAIALTLGSNLNIPGNPTAATQAVGNNTTRLATTAMVQAEIANKRAWTSYTPSFVASSGTYTAASATGSYMIAFGVCFWRATCIITTKGTGATPRIGLPAPALAGMAGAPMPARAINVNFKSGSATIEVGLTTALISAADTTDLGSADGAIIHIMGSYPVA